MDRILLATDGSASAFSAAELSGQLSRGFRAPVDIIHVVREHDLSSPGLYDYITDYTDLEEYYGIRRAAMESAGSRIVTETARIVENAGGAVDHEEVAVGDPASEIVEMAILLKSECIVMGRRGLGEIGGIVLGSVSHKVAQLCEKTLITTI